MENNILRMTRFDARKVGKRHGEALVKVLYKLHESGIDPTTLSFDEMRLRIAIELAQEKEDKL